MSKPKKAPSTKVPAINIDPLTAHQLVTELRGYWALAEAIRHLQHFGDDAASSIEVADKLLQLTAAKPSSAMLLLEAYLLQRTVVVPKKKKLKKGEVAPAEVQLDLPTLTAPVEQPVPPPKERKKKPGPGTVLSSSGVEIDL